MRNNRLVLALLWREFVVSIRRLRKRDLAWIFLGGGALAAYGVGILVVGIAARADILRDLGWLWFGAVPAMMAASGASAGALIGAAAIARAHAPFLRALPIADAERRRMAILAAAVFGIPLALLAGIAAGGSAAIADRSPTWLIGVLGLVGFAAGYGAAAIRRATRHPAATVIAGTDANTDHRLSVSLHPLDRHRPAWIGAWAWGATGGRLGLRATAISAAVFLATAGVLAAIAGFVRNTAMPAAIAATLGGIGIFIMTLRCDPLASPVLRASALRFERALAGLVRLPLTLALAFFALMAGPAVAASPQEWTMPVGGGIGLLVLAGMYAVFAAHFATAPRVARFAFVVAWAIAVYESLEYGRSVLLGLVVLTIFLWVRAKRAYLHG